MIARLMAGFFLLALLRHHDLRNDARRHCDQQIVRADAYPLISARRLAQLMTAPVVYDVTTSRDIPTGTRASASRRCGSARTGEAGRAFVARTDSRIGGAFARARRGGFRTRVRSLRRPARGSARRSESRHRRVLRSARRDHAASHRAAWLSVRRGRSRLARCRDHRRTRARTPARAARSTSVQAFSNVDVAQCGVRRVHRMAAPAQFDHRFAGMR